MKKAIFVAFFTYIRRENKVKGFIYAALFQDY